ncbi:MAG TPA: mismatch-specific DNA-glycosylase [Acidimicrobiales bacterium]|nr:mismatch-specific DNA-glycosylase [Acidimicrobiales bacterium]
MRQRPPSANPVEELGDGSKIRVLDPASAGETIVVQGAGLRAPPTGGAAKLLVRAHPDALPFGRATLRAAQAGDAYLAVPAGRLPWTLAQLHHALAPGAPLSGTFAARTGAGVPGGRRPPGRDPSSLDTDRLADIFDGAGFNRTSIEASDEALSVSAFAARTLPDFVAPGMRLLVCGLNPSLVAADAGYGFAGASNRFWKAAVGAGVLTRHRDPWNALEVHRVGMTDLVKRATPRAVEVTPNEFRSGWRRVGRLAGWLTPDVVCFVGLQGWRVAVNRRAVPGWQPERVGGVPAYVMPSTSGLNARSSLGDLTEHLRRAIGGP